MLLVWAGVQLGANWVTIRDMLKPFDMAIAVAVVVLFLGLLWWRLGMPGWPKKAAPAASTAPSRTDPELGAETRARRLIPGLAGASRHRQSGADRPTPRAPRRRRAGARGRWPPAASRPRGASPASQRSTVRLACAWTNRLR